MSTLLPQEIHSSAADPNAENGEGRNGGAGGHPRSGEYGTVLAYFADTYTSTVHTRRGTIKGVPRLRSAPGQVVAFEPGTEVLLTYEYGDPIILGVITRVSKPDPSATPAAILDVNGFGGEGEDKDLDTSTGNYRLPNEPTSCMSGDYVQMSTAGNLIGVLTGGVNVMRSSPMAQVRTNIFNDLVEIISRNYRHVSDMGEFSINNDGGRINMRFRGGSDQKTETGAGEENWSIKFDLGSEGDMLNLELSTSTGQTLFKFHVNADGQCEIFGVNGVSINSGAANGGTSSEETTGNKAKKIYGNQTTVIDGADATTVGGDASVAATGNYAVRSGNDFTASAVRDVGVSVGRSLNVAVQGSATDSAVVYDIESGDWLVNMGGPTALNPAGSYKMFTWAGNIEFWSVAGGDFNVSTLLGNVNTQSLKTIIDTSYLPDSVILGGAGLGSHVVKYEQLQAHLLNLYNLLDTHIHNIPSTASAGPFPVVGVTAPPVVPLSPQLSPQLPTLKSITTGVAS